MEESQNYTPTTAIARVILIPDKYTVIIDKGSKNGNIRHNASLQIYEPGPEIKDLAGNKLGIYDFIKAEITVTESFENFSVCKRVEKDEAQSLTKTLSPLFSSTKTYFETLNVEEKEISPLNPKEPKIKIGDFVKRK